MATGHTIFIDIVMATSQTIFIDIVMATGDMIVSAMATCLKTLKYSISDRKIRPEQH